ncbi:serine/threonine protein kinase [[Clostridium] aminophilum]|uniref:Serine/threonine protein kinase n=1 Tax=[Clostridium] aminophilum TaxID=1526 RepID=A0A1I0EA52_9FIRM|nr:serine/threonine-protein kinase [[Clostridium] aminophilum]SET41623.1 serine/threonine protein kinase [[Clostridium] aminophilum]
MDQILMGRYKVVRQIGKGGMSTVYLVEHIALHNLWAMKVVEKRKNSQFELLAEPNILKNLSYFSLPRIVDIAEDDMALYIVMDYMQGVELKKCLREHGAFSERQILMWGKEIAGTLDYLHRQSPPIIYRDMKPGNLIVDDDNHLHLIDFGIALKADGQGNTPIYLTKGYAAPEQYTQKGQRDCRVDIYAMGVTLFELATGEDPLQYPDGLPETSSQNPEISDGLSAIIGLCAKKEPEKRFQSAQQVLYALDHVEEYNAGYQKRKQRGRRIRISVLAGSVALLGGIAGGMFWHDRQVTEQYQTIMESAFQSADRGDLSNAEQGFQKAIQIKNNVLEGYLGVAAAKYRFGEYENCLTYVAEEILERFPNALSDSRVNYLLGQVYDGMQNDEKSLEYFRNAIEHDPQNEDYLRDYVIALINDDQLDAASEYLSGSDGAYVAELRRYIPVMESIRSNDYERLTESLKALTAETRDEMILLAAYRQASEYLRHQAVVLNDPGWYDRERALLCIGDAAFSDGRYPEFFEKKGTAAYQYGLALPNAEIREQYYRLALDDYQRAIGFGFDSRTAYKNCTAIYLQLGDTKAAEDMLLAMTQRYPDETYGWKHLTRLYLQSAEANPENTEIHQRLKEVWTRLKELQGRYINEEDIRELQERVETILSSK